MNLAAHPFSLRQLQYAVAVAETLSFRKAAEACHVSQPSLSAQLAQLEAVLGVRLFERDRRRVLLTLPGQALLERARQLLRDADDLAQTARRTQDPLTGSLRLGVIPTVSPYLLPRLTAALRVAHPRLSVQWREDRTSALCASLAAGTLEAAVVALEAELGEVEHEVIGHDPFVLATPLAHPLGQPTHAARAGELRDAEVLLLDDGHCFREQALAFCTSARAHELEFRATSLSTLAQMVAGGTGVTLLPELALPTEAARAPLSLRRFAAPAPQRTIVLAWRRRSPLGPALRELAATARPAFAAVLAAAAAPAPTAAAPKARRTAARSPSPRARPR